MDRRNLLWMSGLVFAAAAGCTRHEVITSDSYTPAAVQSAPRPAERKRKPEQPVKEADLKPDTFVTLANMQAEAAVNEELGDDQRQKNFQLAVQNYRRALQLDPKCRSAVLGLAGLYSCNGDHEQAITLLDAALTKFPDVAAFWFERGMVLGRQKQFDEALANVKRAHQLEPTNGQYSKSVGLMLARMGHAEEGVNWLRKSMTEADARYNVAQIMRHVGQEREARRQFQLAIASNPGHQPSLTAMGIAAPPAAPASDPVQLTAAIAPAVVLPTTALPQRPAAPPTAKRPAVQIGFEPN